MRWINLQDVPEREVFAGFRGRIVHSDSMTFAHWTIREGAALPEHSHPHEQVVNVITGSFELCIDGEPQVLDSGTVAIIPGNALHSGRALSDCHIIDAFYPVREDYLD